MVEIKDLVGKRVLWKPYRNFSYINEGVVKELSPSGKYVKIGNEWNDTNTVIILEVLSD